MHSGAISLSNGGLVYVTKAGAQSTFAGDARNGLTSSPWTSADNSFTVDATYYQKISDVTGVASNALTTAQSAQVTANRAVSNAETAQGTANNAVAKSQVFSLWTPFDGGKCVDANRYSGGVGTLLHLTYCASLPAQQFMINQ